MHIAVGVAVGWAIGGYVEVAKQYAEHGRIADVGRVVGACVGGGVAGGIIAAVPAAGFGALMVRGAVAEGTAGVTNRIISSGGKSFGTVEQVATDMANGAAFWGAWKGAAKALSRLATVSRAAGSGANGATSSGTEVVQRAMSRAELAATQETGLLRGGREGTHYVSDAVNSSATRAQERLALPVRPDVRVTLEVPFGKFSAPTQVQPFDVGPGQVLPGGGMERTATGQIPVVIVRVDAL
jgi:hypothetical protein